MLRAGARARRLTLALVAVFPLEVYVVSSAWVVTGGYGYGARRLSDGAPSAGARRRPSVGARAEARSPWPRRLVAAFVALTRRPQRGGDGAACARKKIASSGAYARSAERFLSDCGLPRLGRLFGVIGYPFVQPAGWLFALAHHVPASTFEGVVGNWFLDRDGQWFQVQSHGARARRGARAATSSSGLQLGIPKTPARVTGPDPHAPADVRGRADRRALHRRRAARARAAPAGTASPSPSTDDAQGRAPAVPGAAVRAGVNELRLTLPAGATLDRIDFDSTTEWWRKR